MLAQLAPLDGQPAITLSDDVSVVGRKPGLCDVIIDDNGVSKLQAVLIKTDGLLYLRDLCSTNGTRVNGQRVVRGVLLPGDEIAFAKVRFQVVLGPDPVPSTEVTAEIVFDEAEEGFGDFSGDFPALDALEASSVPDPPAGDIYDTDSDVRPLDDDD